MTRIPSKARLEQELRLDAETAAVVHKALRDDNPSAAATAAEFSGVEYVYNDKNTLAFQYLNAGDTYATTLVKRPRGDWRISTYGDEIEALERRGARFQ